MLDYDKLIIESLKARDIKLKYRDNLLTFLFWIFWLYLFRPLLALVLWCLFGFHIFNPDIFSIRLYEEIIRVIIKYSMFITLMGVIFISWALYNWVKYRALRRRKFIPHATVQEVAEFFEVEPKNLKKWQESKHIVIKLNEKGLIEKGGVKYLV